MSISSWLSWRPMNTIRKMQPDFFCSHLHWQWSQKAKPTITDGNECMTSQLNTFSSCWFVHQCDDVHRKCSEYVIGLEIGCDKAVWCESKYHQNIEWIMFAASQINDCDSLTLYMYERKKTTLPQNIKAKPCHVHSVVHLNHSKHLFTHG